MATRKPTVADLHIAIEAVCPIVGVARLLNGIRIDYADDATEAQRVQASTIAAAWDWNVDLPAAKTLAQRLDDAEAEIAAIKGGGIVARAR